MSVKKFDILYKVRKVGEDMKLPVSISIGIGVGGSLSENDMYARNALDMALGTRRRPSQHKGRYTV